MEDFQVAGVGHVEQGDIIATLTQQQPDFLILDYHLKGEETANYVKTIRDTPAWKNIGILMISAIDRERQCLQAGANGFMIKPFDWQDILNTIQKISGDLKADR
jgi:CheY-like chemotaxis protein